MTTRKKRRFIAGAVCPKCKSLDTIMLFRENNVEKLECVNCGYADAQTEDQVKSVTRKNENVIGVFKPK